MSNKYSEMSDFEVNTLVAEHRGGYGGKVGDWLPGGVKVIEPGGFGYTERNYCSSDADCMLLAWDNGISVDWVFDGSVT